MLEASRVTEIFTPGPKPSLGSGYQVSPHLFLTARHVVDEVVRTPYAPPPLPSQLRSHLLGLGRDEHPKCRVRTLSDQAQPFVDASVVWAHPDLDVALIGVVTEDWQPRALSSLEWADIEGVDAVACTAVGFPKIEEAVDRVRDTRQIEGQITPFTLWKGRKWAISVQGSIGQEPISTSSSWAGMSGAAVFVGDALVGVIELDADPKDPTRMELLALRAKDFAEDAELVSWIAADSGPRAWCQISPTSRQRASSTTTAPLVPIGAPAVRPEGLAGRTEMIDTAIAQLVGGRDVALISGIPGAGKTAVASYLISSPRVATKFPDGSLWLPVGRGSAAGMAHWVHRLVVWADQLGVGAESVEAARSTEDGHELSRLISDALGDRRALLVFDDVWERSDAVLFKDIGRCCQRVITTRIPEVARVFASEVLPVEELDPDAAKQLIDAHCPGAIEVFGPLLDQVVAKVAGVPLALVLVGMKLNTEYGDYGEGAAREFLTDIRDLTSLQDWPLEVPESQSSLLRGNRTLQAVIGLTTGRLNEAEIDALHSLTAFPPKASSFSDAAGGYVVRKHELVRSLRSNGLLDLANPRTTRWTMHQAIFDFARRDGIDDEAMRRMTTYFAESYIELAESGDSSWVYDVDDDMENVRAAIEWAIRSGESYLGLRLTAALWDYWYKRNWFQRARGLAERVLAIPMPDTPSREHRVLRAKVLNDTGNYAYNMGDLASAERLHTQAREIRQSLGERALVAGSLNNLGLVHRERGDYKLSMTLTQDALTINEETRHKSWLLWKGMNLNNIGIILDRTGEHQAAVESQLASVEAFRQASPDWVPMAQTDMAAALINLGRREDARRLLISVLRSRRPAGDDKRVAAVLRGLARLAGDDQAETAMTWLRFSLQLSVPIFDRLGEVAALASLVNRAAQVGDVKAGARAAGVFDSLHERTGIALSPWRQQALDAAVAGLQDLDPSLYSVERNRSYEATNSGQLSTLGALGQQPDDPGLNRELDRVTAG